MIRSGRCVRRGEPPPPPTTTSSQIPSRNLKENKTPNKFWCPPPLDFEFSKKLQNKSLFVVFHLLFLFPPSFPLFLTNVPSFSLFSTSFPTFFPHLTSLLLLADISKLHNMIKSCFYGCNLSWFGVSLQRDWARRGRRRTTDTRTERIIEECRGTSSLRLLRNY